MANLNERMVTLGTQRSVIRELFEFGKKRAAEIGAENVFDFSIGNPSVPSPEQVNETAVKLINEKFGTDIKVRYYDGVPSEPKKESEDDVNVSLYDDAYIS